MPFSVDRLEPLYREHKMTLRKHTGKHPSWTAREPTVIDLDETERALLERDGDEVLDRHLRAQGQFPVPALDIHSLKPLHLPTELSHGDSPTVRIFVPAQGDLCEAAGAICEMLQKHGAPPPPVFDADEFDLLDLSASHAIVLGGAHENVAAALLADRGWLDADRRFPGPGGWLLRTVHNVAGLGHNVLHLVADASTREQALITLQAALTGNSDGVVCGKLDEVHPGPEARDWIGGWEEWKRRFAEVAFRGRVYEYRDIPDTEEYAGWLATCFDCGGPEGDIYNRGPMRVGAISGRLYRMTGDRRFLELNRWMLLALADYYCNFPGGASYLADYDFDLHETILYWDLLEEEDVFSNEERLLITNFLLASVRMCEGYRQERWPVRGGALRHNHETFPGLSTYMGGRYFGDYYDIPEAEEWIETAQDIFSGAIENRTKHREDANGYQWMVPAHKLAYDALNGEDDLANNGVLDQLARALIATTDNLGHPADFGDAGRPISSGSLQASLLEIIAGKLDDTGLQWWSEKLWHANPEPASTWIGSFLGEIRGSCRMSAVEPPDPPVLEVIPLEEHIREMAAPQMPRPYVFDKAALRDGHDPQDAYLLLDGYSAGSHMHYDQNALIRYSAAGRLWIVDNGYGKRSGESAAGKAFSNRELGPQDHNTLLVYDADGSLLRPPPFCALLAAETAGPLTLLQSAIAGHGPTDWLRTIVWIAGAGFLLLDQVNVTGEVSELRCQLNMLGEVTLDGASLTCSQHGRWMHASFEPGSEISTSSYTNESWDSEFASGAYPHAESPVKKLDRIMKPATGESICLAVLIAAGDSPVPPLELAISGSEITVRGDLPSAEVALEGHGASAQLADGALTVRCDERWRVPNDLPRLPAEDARYSLRV
jgi:hypothetical protein